MSSFKSNENIHKKDDRSYYVVLANKASSVFPCNDPTKKARGNKLQYEFDADYESDAEYESDTE